MGGGRFERFPEMVLRLVELLGEPEEGELNYTGRRKAMSRLDALRELRRLEMVGVIDQPRRCGGVNTHIHTSESFGIFRSPTEAAWKGYREGLDVFGINDHYTIAGHKEFGEACKILGMKATFGIEAIAMSNRAKRRGERYNDPKNPGRIYLCGKGVVHGLESGSFGWKLLKTMRLALRRRYERMTEKAVLILEEVEPSLDLAFEDVLRLTTRGNVTERHVGQAMAQVIERRFPEERQRRDFLTRLPGISEEDLSREQTLQDLLRNKLLKVGGPAYVEEPSKAFPGFESLVALFREVGAIPTYPVLGNPITERESDLDSLVDELESLGIFAVEVIPKRNTKERLIEILKTAERHGFPIFNGTEHNTRSAEPLLDEFSKHPNFLPTFRKGAYLILGHQFLSKHAKRGYVDLDGRLTFTDRTVGTGFFTFVGGVTWPKDFLEWLTTIGKEDVFKVALGLYDVLNGESSEWIVKPGLRVPLPLLKNLKIVNGRILYTDQNSRVEFARLVEESLTPGESIDHADLPVPP